MIQIRQDMKLSSGLCERVEAVEKLLTNKTKSI